MQCIPRGAFVSSDVPRLAVQAKYAGVGTEYTVPRLKPYLKPLVLLFTRILTKSITYRLLVTM
jgi:hypothetical protein